MGELIEASTNSQVLPISPEAKLVSLMEVAISSGANIESLEKLLDLQERWEASGARKSFFSALSKFQTALPVIGKNGLASFDHRNGGGNTSYSYARLEDIAAAIKPLLKKNGLSYRYEQRSEQGGLIVVSCIVTHLDGHAERAEMGGMPDTSGKKNMIQQLASTVSYLRRYTLTGAFGITVSEEDDDAQGGDAQQEQAEFFPQEDFEARFPGWEKTILDGKKTTAQLIAYLEDKGAKLSLAQIKTINQVGK
jgi:hypothetical protein